eukprot:TRINITY_DN385_c0_g2_i3.p2 TRINITY_DN385_c0_g2~~TRINITY_DN385_c0_g2_i3.p2  ORF type:complete len:694 (+),score=263.57 TRINITY_DN385_c0_g2_i3:84-2084(+)
MLYDFYLALAVRATGSEQSPVPECELTQLAWAVMDARSGEFADSRSLAVAPSRSSAPCSTGALSFEAAVAALDRYIEEQITGPGSTFALVTDGPFPLRRAIKLEAAGKGTHLPQHWSVYYDIRKEAMRLRPASAAALTSLPAVAEAFGVQYAGADGTAAAECTAVREVLRVMLQEGSPLSHRPQQIPSGDRAVQERQWRSPPVSRDRIQHQQQQAQQASGFADELSAQQVCVRMRGLPFQATPGDVRRFLQGLDIAEPDGIQFLYNLQGKSKGEAFVRLASEEHARQAAARDKQFMGDRYVEVFAASLQDMRYCLAQSNPSTAGSTIVRCRGMPYSTSAEDVAAFFEGCTLAPGGVSMCVGPQGKPTGEAFVQFAAEEDVSRALRRHRSHLGGRYVEIFRSSQQEMVSQCHQRLRPLGHKRGAERPASPSQFSPHVVRLRGLPFSLNEMDVASLFAGLGVRRHGIHMVYSAEEKPTGEAFVEFETAGDVERAAAKHKTPIGHRYVEVFRSAPEEIALAAGAYEHDPEPLSAPARGQPPLTIEQGPCGDMPSGPVVRRVIVRTAVPQPQLQWEPQQVALQPAPQYYQPQYQQPTFQVVSLQPQWAPAPMPQSTLTYPEQGATRTIVVHQMADPQTAQLQQHTAECSSAPLPVYGAGQQLVAWGSGAL